MCKADYFPPRTHIPQAYWLTGCLICSPQPTRDSSEFTECAMVKDGGLRIGGGKQNTSMIAGGWGWSVCVLWVGGWVGGGARESLVYRR